MRNSIYATCHVAVDNKELKIKQLHDRVANAGFFFEICRSKTNFADSQTGLGTEGVMLVKVSTVLAKNTAMVCSGLSQP